MRTFLLVALSVIVAHLASSSPVAAPSHEDVLAQLQSMQEQMDAMRAQLAEKKAVPSVAERFTQQKRMVAWQPMKRSGSSGVDIDRETLFRAIEARLMEVLAAGERLGISPEEILEHIRERNTRI
ncbi:hypothetical protein PMAYCL1PPCAC_22467 [Pristionchus mayeri]|uniref:Uncharacterized protein n=1 Tax=Pristionchus mayeri TaxID=1317129 RepID=A0AAN5I4T9_9BILA|nr:hypothetical protein PMAYCL1PPCAC_22467 [Pristionchus mayeri]